MKHAAIAKFFYRRAKITQKIVPARLENWSIFSAPVKIFGYFLPARLDSRIFLPARQDRQKNLPARCAANQANIFTGVPT